MSKFGNILLLTIFMQNAQWAQSIDFFYIQKINWLQKIEIETKQQFEYDVIILKDRKFSVIIHVTGRKKCSLQNPSVATIIADQSSNGVICKDAQSAYVYRRKLKKFIRIAGDDEKKDETDRISGCIGPEGEETPVLRLKSDFTVEIFTISNYENVKEKIFKYKPTTNASAPRTHFEIIFQAVGLRNMSAHGKGSGNRQGSRVLNSSRCQRSPNSAYTAKTTCLRHVV